MAEVDVYSPAPPALLYERYAIAPPAYATVEIAAPFAVAGSPTPPASIATTDTITLVMTFRDGPPRLLEVLVTSVASVVEPVFAATGPTGAFAAGFSGSLSIAGLVWTLTINRSPGWFGTPTPQVLIQDVAGEYDWVTVGTWSVSPGVSIAPVVSGITPTPGTTITPTQAVQCDVTSGASPLRAILLIVKLLDGRWECVHDGTNFAPGYASSTRDAVTNGFRYVLRRNFGWPPGGITGLLPVAVNQLGREN